VISLSCKKKRKRKRYTQRAYANKIIYLRPIYKSYTAFLVELVNFTSLEVLVVEEVTSIDLLDVKVAGLEFSIEGVSAEAKEALRCLEDLAEEGVASLEVANELVKFAGIDLIEELTSVKELLELTGIDLIEISAETEESFGRLEDLAKEGVASLELSDSLVELAGIDLRVLKVPAEAKEGLHTLEDFANEGVAGFKVGHELFKLASVNIDDVVSEFTGLDVFKITTETEEALHALEDLANEGVPDLELSIIKVTGGNTVFNGLGQRDGESRGSSEGSDEDTGGDLDHVVKKGEFV